MLIFQIVIHYLIMKPNSKEPNKERIWRIILLLVLTGAVFIFFVSTHKLSGPNWREDYITALGAGLLIAGACFCLGALTGFLFGIPRIINSNPSATPLTSSRGTVIQNDNLVQISDWLTKIIVGVGLTQVNEIPLIFDRLGNLLGPCFSKTPETPDSISSAIALSIVMYFLILGFIACYLWTRFHFSEMLEEALEIDEDGQGPLQVTATAQVTQWHGAEAPAEGTD